MQEVHNVGGTKLLGKWIKKFVQNGNNNKFWTSMSLYN